MARHKLSLKEQLRGVEHALRSRRTPKQFREGLRKRKKQLERALGKPEPHAWSWDWDAQAR